MKKKDAYTRADLEKLEEMIDSARRQYEALDLKKTEIAVLKLESGKCLAAN